MREQLQLRCVPQVSQGCFPGPSEQWTQTGPWETFYSQGKADEVKLSSSE